MISLSVLRRLLRWAARCGQVSRGAPKVLQQLNDELLEDVATRAAELAEDGRIDVPDVVVAWRERVFMTDDNAAHGEGPQTAFLSPTICFSGPSSTDSRELIYTGNPGR